MLILGSPPQLAEKHGGSQPLLSCLNLRGEAEKGGSMSVDRPTGRSEGGGEMGGVAFAVKQLHGF